MLNCPTVKCIILCLLTCGQEEVEHTLYDIYEENTGVSGLHTITLKCEPHVSERFNTYTSHLYEPCTHGNNNKITHTHTHITIILCGLKMWLIHFINTHIYNAYNNFLYEHKTN